MRTGVWGRAHTAVWVAASPRALPGELEGKGTPRDTVKGGRWRYGTGRSEPSHASACWLRPLGEDWLPEQRPLSLLNSIERLTAKRFRMMSSDPLELRHEGICSLGSLKMSLQ